MNTTDDHPARFDFTGNIARQLHGEHAERANADHERRVREAQEKHPRSHVHWDDEINDVVVDYTS